jgi:hypothetical protein
LWLTLSWVSFCSSEGWSTLDPNKYTESLPAWLINFLPKSFGALHLSVWALLQQQYQDSPHMYPSIPKHITVSRPFVSGICPNCPLFSQTNPSGLTEINILFPLPSGNVRIEDMHQTSPTRELTLQLMISNYGYCCLHKYRFTILYILG